MSNALNTGNTNDPSLFGPAPLQPYNPNAPQSTETKNAMTEAKQTAASFTKHLQDAATAYEAGATHNGMTHKKLITSIEATAVLIADCVMVTEAGRRQIAMSEKCQTHLEKHKTEFAAKCSGTLSRCSNELSASLSKAKLHR